MPPPQKSKTGRWNVVIGTHHTKCARCKMRRKYRPSRKSLSSRSLPGHSAAGGLTSGSQRIPFGSTMDAMEFTKWDTIQVMIWTSKHKRFTQKTKKKNFRENKCHMYYFFNMTYEVSFFSLNQSICKKFTCLFNKDKVEVNSRLCRSQI